MEKFLGILLIIIFSLVILRWIMRLVLPLLLGWLMKKIAQKTFQQTFNFGFQRQEPQGDEGEVKVDGNTSQNKNSKKRDMGEYVEFEEIKD